MKAETPPMRSPTPMEPTLARRHPNRGERETTSEQKVREQRESRNAKQMNKLEKKQRQNTNLTKWRKRKEARDRKRQKPDAQPNPAAGRGVCRGKRTTFPQTATQGTNRVVAAVARERGEPNPRGGHAHAAHRDGVLQKDRHVYGVRPVHDVPASGEEVEQLRILYSLGLGRRVAIYSSSSFF
jgi:hypothetical protein